jgi:hypothetical protein
MKQTNSLFFFSKNFSIIPLHFSRAKKNEQKSRPRGATRERERERNAVLRAQPLGSRLFLFFSERERERVNIKGATRT